MSKDQHKDKTAKASEYANLNNTLSGELAKAEKSKDSWVRKAPLKIFLQDILILMGLIGVVLAGIGIYMTFN